MNYSSEHLRWSRQARQGLKVRLCEMPIIENLESVDKKNSLEANLNDLSKPFNCLLHDLINARLMLRSLVSQLQGYFKVTFPMGIKEQRQITLKVHGGKSLLMFNRVLS